MTKKFMHTTHDGRDRTIDNRDRGRRVSAWVWARPLSLASFQSVGRQRFRGRRNSPVRAYTWAKVWIMKEYLTGSVWIHGIATDKRLPAGIVIPSEKVKSFIVLRVIRTVDYIILRVDRSTRIDTYMPRLAITSLFLWQSCPVSSSLRRNLYSSPILGLLLRFLRAKAAHIQDKLPSCIASV